MIAILILLAQPAMPAPGAAMDNTAPAMEAADRMAAPPMSMEQPSPAKKKNKKTVKLDESWLLTDDALTEILARGFRDSITANAPRRVKTTRPKAVKKPKKTDSGIKIRVLSDNKAGGS